MIQQQSAIPQQQMMVPETKMKDVTPGKLQVTLNDMFTEVNKKNWYLQPINGHQMLILPL
jgi:hypothetical protein